jgi:hypothetical protein
MAWWNMDYGIWIGREGSYYVSFHPDNSLDKHMFPVIWRAIYEGISVNILAGRNYEYTPYCYNVTLLIIA